MSSAERSVRKPPPSRRLSAQSADWNNEHGWCFCNGAVQVRWKACWQTCQQTCQQLVLENEDVGERGPDPTAESSERARLAHEALASSFQARRSNPGQQPQPATSGSSAGRKMDVSCQDCAHPCDRARRARQEAPMTWGYVTCDDLAEMYYNCVYRGIIPENGRCNALCNGGLPLCSLPNDHAQNGQPLHSFELPPPQTRKRRRLPLNSSSNSLFREQTGDADLGRPNSTSEAKTNSKCSNASGDCAAVHFPDEKTFEELEEWVWRFVAS